MSVMPSGILSYFLAGDFLPVCYFQNQQAKFPDIWGLIETPNIKGSSFHLP